MLGGAPKFFAARCPRGFFDSWSERGKDRLEPLDYGIVTADHQAIASL
jgi:hypothetical protein